MSMASVQAHDSHVAQLGGYIHLDNVYNENRSTEF